MIVYDLHVSCDQSSKSVQVTHFNYLQPTISCWLFVSVNHNPIDDKVPYLLNQMQHSNKLHFEDL